MAYFIVYPCKCRTPSLRSHIEYCHEWRPTGLNDKQTKNNKGPTFVRFTQAMLDGTLNREDSGDG